jgi:hypothetical protein
MKKLLLVVFILFSLELSAQTNATSALSAGLELAIPSNSVYNIGTGASIKGELPLANPLSLTLTGGITTMFYKSNLFNSSRTPGAAVFIPLKGGLKWYFNKAVYAEGEAGAALETNYDKKTSFAFSIGPGFVVPAGDSHGVDIGFRYESWANQLRQTAIRIAYRF